MDSKIMLMFTLAVMAVLLVGLPDVVNAVCCQQVGTGGMCGDCSRPTPCCGKQKCNLFCCACKGGSCWSGNCNGRRRRSDDQAISNITDVRSARDIVSYADSDSDKLLSFEEAQAFLGERGGRTTRSLFQSLDLDNDNKLSAIEIDPFPNDDLE